MVSAQASCMNHVWLFLNQCQRDAEPELLNGPRGTNTSAGNAVRWAPRLPLAFHPRQHFTTNTSCHELGSSCPGSSSGFTPQGSNRPAGSVDDDGPWSAAGQGLTFIGYQVIRWRKQSLPFKKVYFQHIAHMLVCFLSLRIHQTVEMFIQVQSPQTQTQWPRAWGRMRITANNTSNELTCNALLKWLYVKLDLSVCCSVCSLGYESEIPSLGQFMRAVNQRLSFGLLRCRCCSSLAPGGSSGGILWHRSTRPDRPVAAGFPQTQ